MRSKTLFVAGVVFAVAVPGIAQSQESRLFEDSWFWGVKSGVTTFAPTLGGNETSASYGIDWLITRRMGALYLSLDESNVSTVSAVFDAGAREGVRPVAVDKLRRFGVAGLAFPKRFGRFRPYAGIGLSVATLPDAVPLLDESEDGADDAVLDRIDERSSQAALFGMLGAQMQFQRLAVFVQGSVMPGDDRFLLNDSVLGFWEAGLRYNFGKSRQ